MSLEKYLVLLQQEVLAHISAGGTAHDVAVVDDTIAAAKQPHHRTPARLGEKGVDAIEVAVLIVSVFVTVQQ